MGIDKSSTELWAAARAAVPGGFAAIFDATGLETLQQGYDHLAMTGRLIAYGFHSNLPSKSGTLNPLNWLKMGLDMLRMPKFETMSMVLECKGMIGFNLSFFSEELDLLKAYLTQITKWLET